MTRKKVEKMESFYSDSHDKLVDASMGTEFVPYLKTAGTVLIGWMVVTWIWHVRDKVFSSLPRFTSKVRLSNQSFKVHLKDKKLFISLNGVEYQERILSLVKTLNIIRY